MPDKSVWKFTAHVAGEPGPYQQIHVDMNGHTLFVDKVVFRDEIDEDALMRGVNTLNSRSYIWLRFPIIRESRESAYLWHIEQEARPPHLVPQDDVDAVLEMMRTTDELEIRTTNTILHKLGLID